MDTIHAGTFLKEEGKRYQLLNKDVEIAEFHVTEHERIVLDRQFQALPDWISNLSVFIRNRRAPKHRENIAKLLELSGCDTITGYLDISHALSLIDTFWVKSYDSNLCWKDVSLYTHDFNEVIARTAFEGGLHGRNLSTTSPEYGTDGSFAKCWIREEGQIKMLKRGSSGARNAGLEPYSEFYASQIAKHFGIPYVEYGLRSTSNKICSVCNIFTSEQYGYLPYSAVDFSNSSMFEVVDECVGMKFEKEIKTMFVLDAVIMNEDRHKNNFGFLIDNDKQEIVNFAPLFDHNISLLPYAEEEDFQAIDAYLSCKGPRLADSFLQSASYCLTPKLRNVLMELADFTFERHPKFNLPEWRLNALEKQIQRNILEILKN